MNKSAKYDHVVNPSDFKPGAVIKPVAFKAAEGEKVCGSVRIIKVATKKSQPTPKNPQTKNPLRRAMKTAGKVTRNKLSQMSLARARHKEMLAWQAAKKKALDKIWANQEA